MMNRKIGLAVSVLALAVASPAASAQMSAAQPATALFASDAPINLVIRGPMSALANKRADTPLPGTMTDRATGMAYPVMLTPRGITRKMSEICTFPPLRVELSQPAPAGSLFETQRRLKLVTHCRSSADFQQKVLLEYAAYRLYNQVTPASFRARLANIEYQDDSGRTVTNRVGFFIEDDSDVGKRNGFSKARVGDTVPLAQIEPAAAARFAVFNYMIGNLDWSMRAGPIGEECCHNGKLYTPPGGGALVPVPYDFDFSGLVDAPYATPPEGFKMSSVRQRNFRGYCAHNAQIVAAANDMLQKRDALVGTLATIPGLDGKSRAKAETYLNAFFGDLTSGKMMKTCVR